MYRYSRAYRRPASWTTPIVLAVLATGCGGETPFELPDPPDPEPDNVAPVLAPIAEQVVRLNTIRTPSVAVELSITDPDDDRFDVTVSSDDESVLPPQELTCRLAPCAVTLEPDTDAPVELTVTVTVADDDGAEASGAFVLRVGARLVTSADELGPGTLATVIEESEPGDVVGFDTDGVFATPQTISLLAEIGVEHHLTIEGPGADVVTVSGSNSTRVFRVDDGAEVSMIGLRVADGVAPVEQVEIQGQTMSTRLGGGVLATGGSRLTLVDVVVAESSSPEDVDLSAGGGIANRDATLVMRGGEVTGSTGGLGGGIATVAAGVHPATTVLEGVAVQGNVGELGGGVASRQGSLVLRGGRIEGNRAVRGGGAYSEGSLLVDADVAIVDNQASGTGGGVAAVAGELSVEASTLSDNTADEGGGLVIYSGATATLTGVTVTGNDAIAGGGAFVAGTLAVDGDSRFSSNRSIGSGPGAGGGAINASGTLTVRDTEFTDNTSDTDGGALESFGAATLTDVVMTGNSAGVDGGAVQAAGAIELRRVTFRSNLAGDGGGGLNNEGSAAQVPNALIVESVFEANRAASGGAVAGGRGSGTLIEDSAFRDNKASGFGGALQLSDGDLEIRRSSISGNSARIGGGIWAQGGSVSLLEADVLENLAEAPGSQAGAGAGVVVSLGSITITDSRLEANIATGFGGGVLSFSSNVQLVRTSVTDNRAGLGAGLFLSGGAVFVRDDSRIAANAASGAGGGIYGESDGNPLTLSFSDSRVEGNTAEAGGGMHIAGTDLVATRSRIGNNRAEEDGGGVLAAARSVRLVDTTVIANQAGRHGGGLSVSGVTVSATGSGCLILGNRADTDGDGEGEGGGLRHFLSNLSALPSNKVCQNNPDDISP